MSVGEQLREAFDTKVETALVELLEKKHLYQSVLIKAEDFASLISDLGKKAFEEDTYHPSPSISGTNFSAPKTTATEHSKQLRQELNEWLARRWNFVNSLQGRRELHNAPQRELSFSMPTVRVACSICDNSVQPHNPGYLSDQVQHKPFPFQFGHEIGEVHTLTFQCQNCKGEPLIFMVVRRGRKLTLAGRSQFPEVLVSDFIPDAQRKFYRNAIIADQTSFALAAALYLRTVVEQYFYAVIPEEKIKAITGNPTGDELADLYAETLPKNFPNNFPSLKKAYDDLSAIIHSGKENDETKKSFAAIRTAVDGHFKAIRLFKEIPTQ